MVQSKNYRICPPRAIWQDSLTYLAGTIQTNNTSCTRLVTVGNVPGIGPHSLSVLVLKSQINHCCFFLATKFCLLFVARPAAHTHTHRYHFLCRARAVLPSVVAPYPSSSSFPALHHRFCRRGKGSAGSQQRQGTRAILIETYRDYYYCCCRWLCCRTKGRAIQKPHQRRTCPASGASRVALLRESLAAPFARGSVLIYVNIVSLLFAVLSLGVQGLFCWNN